ncbi:manganese efflux pump MntP [Alicyclobacillus mengziensis]|nr:manganese efflux pump [Alicyclobacillus mengziensis]
MVWQLIVLGVAMGLNNALASIALGTSGIKRSRQLQIALLFAVFEAIMPLFGILLGNEVARLIGNHARYIGVGLLGVVGIYFFLKAADTESEEVAQAGGLPGFKVIVLAIALSLDNLTVGFGLGMLNVPLTVAAIAFGCISLAMTYIGLEIGRFLGARISVSADKLSGIVLIAVAGMMLILH